MGVLMSEILNDMSDGRERRAMYTMFNKIFNNDANTTNKAIVFGAAATPISVAGAFTTGLEISADGTTAISVTSGFSGTTGLLFNGTATNGISLTGACATAAISISGAEAIGLSILTSTPTDGINIAAACANAIAIGGANTTAGINITGAEAVGIQIATSTPVDGILISAACADGIQLSGANTANAINISGASTLNAITVSGTSGDTGIEISGTAANFAIDISGAQTAVGISVAGTCGTYGLAMTGACTTAAIGITGAEAIGILVATSTPTIGLSITSACATGISISGTNTASAIDVSAKQASGAGLDAASVFKHGTQTTGIAYGVQSDDLILKSMHITGSVATGQYILGDVVMIDTTADSAGHIFARKNYITVNHATGAVRAIYNQVDITATALLNENVTGMKCGIDINAGTITGVGKISGITVEVDVLAGCTVANHIYGIEVDMRDIKVDTAGDKVGIKITKAGADNYLDYGLLFSNQFANTTAVIGFDLTQGNVAAANLCAVGGQTLTSYLVFTDSGGQITNLIDFTGTSGANGSITSDSGTVATDWECRIRCLSDDGTPVWINAYRTSNEA